MTKAIIRERFASKVRVDASGCWLWSGYHDEDGYARFSIKGHPKRAARISYELFVGKIPEGFTIDHICRVRSCVNPEHLEPVTSEENTIRAGKYTRNATKTHCKRGHPFSKENTLFRQYRGRQHRMCRTCGIDRQRADRESKRSR